MKASEEMIDKRRRDGRREKNNFNLVLNNISGIKTEFSNTTHHQNVLHRHLPTRNSPYLPILDVKIECPSTDEISVIVAASNMIPNHRKTLSKHDEKSNQKISFSKKSKQSRIFFFTEMFLFIYFPLMFICLFLAQQFQKHIQNE